MTTITVDRPPRIFKIDAIEAPDPGPGLSLAQVRSLLATTYPQVTNAEVEGPVARDGKLIYTFRTAIGTKG